MIRTPALEELRTGIIFAISELQQGMAALSPVLRSLEQTKESRNTIGGHRKLMQQSGKAFFVEQDERFVDLMPGEWRDEDRRQLSVTEVSAKTVANVPLSDFEEASASTLPAAGPGSSPPTPFSYH